MVLNPTYLKNGFTSAIQLDILDPLPLPITLQSYFAGIVDRFERGLITLLEADKSSIKIIHQELHGVMANAITKDWEVKLVDIANCFNPQLISAITLDLNISSHQVLQNISLSRPFQIHQSMSAIKQLAVQIEQSRKHVQRSGKIANQLVIVTCVSSQFLDPAQASEDENYPVPQLELLRHSLGILQNLAVQGCTVIITELIDGVSKRDEKKSKRYQNTSLAYTSKVHIRFTEREYLRMIELKNHPYLPCKLVKIPRQKQRKQLDEQQSSLNSWF